MAGSSRAATSWAVVALLGAAAALRPGCATEPGESFDAGPMLANLAEGVILPTLEDALLEASHVEESLASWAGDSDADVEAAWRSAAAAWQRAEVMQVGPAASSLAAVGGEDRRVGLYSWPVVNPCRVDQELVERGWEEPGFFDANPENVRGLDALEYLVFHPEGNACAGQHAINDQGTWDALSPAELASRRADYGRAVAGRFVDDLAALVERWRPQGGGFVRELAEPGSEGSAYDGEHEAVSAVFDALFYLEIVSKDLKLAEPMGLGTCSGPCPDAVESRWADASLDHLLENVRGVRLLFAGGEGLGLDDLLASLGEEALAQAVLDALDGAEAAIVAAPGPLSALVVDDPDAATAVHAAVKQVTDLLKNDLATTLVLELPGEAAGDND